MMPSADVLASAARQVFPVPLASSPAEQNATTSGRNTPNDTVERGQRRNNGNTHQRRPDCATGRADSTHLIQLLTAKTLNERTTDQTSKCQVSRTPPVFTSTPRGPVAKDKPKALASAGLTSLDSQCPSKLSLFLSMLTSSAAWTRAFRRDSFSVARTSRPCRRSLISAQRSSVSFLSRVGLRLGGRQSPSECLQSPVVCQP